MSAERILKYIADEYAKYLAEYLKTRNYPSGDIERGLKPIQDTIEVGQPKPTDYGCSVEVLIGGPEAPYALAFEYGSGLHATKGKKDKYPIRGNPYLAFYWEKIGEFVVLPTVKHPGIKPIPFVEPTLKSFYNERLKKIIATKFKTEVLWVGRPKVVRI